MMTKKENKAWAKRHLRRREKRVGENMPTFDIMRGRASRRGHGRGVSK